MIKFYLIFFQGINNINSYGWLNLSLKINTHQRYEFITDICIKLYAHSSFVEKQTIVSTPVYNSSTLFSKKTGYYQGWYCITLWC